MALDSAGSRFAGIANEILAGITLYQCMFKINVSFIQTSTSKREWRVLDLLQSAQSDSNVLRTFAIQRDDRIRDACRIYRHMQLWIRGQFLDRIMMEASLIGSLIYECTEKIPATTGKCYAGHGHSDVSTINIRLSDIAVVKSSADFGDHTLSS
jgi:hypothetical protein